MDLLPIPELGLFAKMSVDRAGFRRQAQDTDANVLEVGLRRAESAVESYLAMAKTFPSN